jgi:DNA-directed RNA polymerase specialized sigma24 family protein
VRFAVFSRYELEGEKPTYADLAAELGVPETKITNDLHAARKRFRTLLLERLRSLCADEAEYQAEARALLGNP